MVAMWNNRDSHSTEITRRRMLEGTGLGLASLTLPGVASANFVPAPNPADYVLGVKRATINPDGEKPVQAITINDELPGPTLRFMEGDSFRVRVENHMADEATTMHWHGMLVPDVMDGVPEISQPAIAPGRSFVYEFPIVQNGTYWYHSHSGL